MPNIKTIFLFLLYSLKTSLSIYKDEANTTDFHIPTCGHGSISSAFYTNDKLVSFGSGFICGRDAENGTVVWRRKVNTKKIVVLKDAIYSISDGVVKRWNGDGDVTHESFFENGLDIFGYNDKLAIWANGHIFIVDEFLEQLGIVDDLKVRIPKGGSLNVVAAKNGYFVLAIYDANDSMSAIAMLTLKDTSIDKITSHKLSNLDDIDVTSSGIIVATESNGVWIVSDTAKFHSVASIRWDFINGVKVLEDDYVQLSGSTVALFKITNGSLQAVDLVNASAFAMEDGSISAVSQEDDQYIIYSYKDDALVSKTPIELKPYGTVTNMILSNNYIVVSTSRGTTITTKWHQEEALGFISKALFLDSHTNTNDKSSYFGFQKLLLLLSDTYNTLFAMETASNKGSITYTIPLPQAKHVLVHGNPTSKSGVHGAYFSTSTKHVNEVLVISTNDKLTLTCIYTPNGTVTYTNEIPLKKEIANIFPIYNENNEYCKQGAIILYKDNTMETLLQQNIPNMYLHQLNNGTLTCHKSDTLELTGQTTLKQETILHTYYPSREEVVQTPSTILGDDSLLVKYLNPHIMVIVSQVAYEYLDELKENKLVNLIMGHNVKKKPLGVGNTTTTKQSIPTLFITLVDTTSCRILHRVSHATSTTNVPLAISENWIVYSYFNQNSKRTEVSVLTLYEGMIDKHGITAFQAPEQEMTFDSFIFPKPIVLQKTFAISKQVSSIGVTTTSRGITSKNFLFGLQDVGWVWKVDSRMLDPRRPTAELKTTEKMEGLIRYSPLLPILTTHVLSYNLHIDNPTHIISSSARLESQSLVFVYGGADLFFTRVAPSKGFDVLPDDFSRGLVGMLTVGLLGVLAYVKRIGERKVLKAAWA